MCTVTEVASFVDLIATLGAAALFVLVIIFALMIAQISKNLTSDEYAEFVSLRRLQRRGYIVIHKVYAVKEAESGCQKGGEVSWFVDYSDEESA